MAWAINLVSRIAGVAGWLTRARPIALALSGLLAALSHILGQAGMTTTPAETLDLLKTVGNSADAAAIALAVAQMRKAWSERKNAKPGEEPKP